MARALATGPRTWMWAVAVLAGLAGCLLAASTCGTSTAAPTRAPAPVRLAIGYAGPGAVQGMGARGLVYLISAERFVLQRRDGRVEPSLAERWEQSADGLTWRFFLRPNLIFHDKTPINATVIATQIRACRVRPPINPGCPDIVSVDAEGPLTVVIRLRRVSSLLLDSLSTMPIYNDAKSEVSAGPFRYLSNPAPNATSFFFEAFPSYHRGAPAIDRVELKLFPSARNAWAAMMRGEIDMLYEVAPDALDFIEQSSNTQVRSFLRPYVFTMALNVRHPALAHPDVRRALNLAVNRTEIIARVFRGHGYPATDHIWPGHWAYQHERPRHRYEPAEAIRLLEAAGFKMPPPSRTGHRADTPSRFRFTCIIPEKDARFERMGLLIQRQLIEVGIDMQIETVPVTAITKRLPAGQFDAFMLDLISSTGLDRVYQMWHSPEDDSDIADTGYRAADAALDRLREARTDEDTRAALGALQRVMHDDPPAVSLLWSEGARAVSTRFRVPLTPGRDIFGTLPQWQLSTAPDPSSP